jgi:hypothetical protein
MAQVINTSKFLTSNSRDISRRVLDFNDFFNLSEQFKTPILKDNKNTIDDSSILNKFENSYNVNNSKTDHRNILNNNVMIINNKNLNIIKSVKQKYNQDLTK